MLKIFLVFQILVTLLIGNGRGKSSTILLDNGFIDYQNRIILAKGTSLIVERRSNSGGLEVIEKNLKISKGEAKAKARENLYDILKLVNFDGRTVGELILEDPLTKNRIKSLVESSFQQGEIEYLEKKEVSISLAVKMSGVAEILIDAGGHLNENISQSTFLMTKNLVPKSERVSGIIIDARNIYHIPAMVPKIFSEADKLVYGPRHYTRSRSVNRGPIGYAHSTEDGNVVRRVGNNPIFIEAISSDDTVNLTVSNYDADKIRDVEKKFGLLTNCKVLVLLK
jgi:hypothetical protein